MTKKRKSVVNKELEGLKQKRDLPTPEETSAAVEETTGSRSSKKRGRPESTHGKVRYNTMIRPEHRDKLKLIALRDHRQIHEVMEDALTAFFKAYEEKNGPLNL